MKRLLRIIFFFWDFGPEPDKGVVAPSNSLDMSEPGGVDLERQFEEILTTQNTTAASATRHNFGFTVVGAGNWKIEITYDWSHNSPTNDFTAQMLIDGVASWDHQQEPKDAAGGSINGSGTNQRHPAHIRRVVSLTAGAHNVTLNFGTSVLGVISTIHRSVLTVERFN